MLRILDCSYFDQCSPGECICVGDLNTYISESFTDINGVKTVTIEGSINDKNFTFEHTLKEDEKYEDVRKRGLEAWKAFTKPLIENN
jgi:hypothetical protein